MFSPIGGENSAARLGACCGCGCAGLVAAGVITMLVCGILGLTGHLSMAPVGARVMVGISVTIMISVATGCIKCICFK